MVLCQIEEDFLVFNVMVIACQIYYSDARFISLFPIIKESPFTINPRRQCIVDRIIRNVEQIHAV